MSNPIVDASRRLRSALFVALGVLTTAGLVACGGDGQDGGSVGDTAAVSGQGLPSPGGQGSGAMAEMRQLNKQLRSIQQQAMKDSALQRQATELQGLIQKTMREMSPRAGERMARMDSLRGRLQQAQAQKDTARLRTLIMEAQKLQRSLQKLRNRAMQEEEVAAALKQFRKDLRARMRQVDPTADSLMERADSLQKEMQSQARGMMGGATSDTAGG